LEGLSKAARLLGKITVSRGETQDQYCPINEIRFAFNKKKFPERKKDMRRFFKSKEGRPFCLKKPASIRSKEKEGDGGDDKEG